MTADRSPENSVRWDSYVIGMRELCAMAGIPVGSNDVVEADLISAGTQQRTETAVRLTIKRLVT